METIQERDKTRAEAARAIQARVQGIKDQLAAALTAKGRTVTHTPYDVSVDGISIHLKVSEDGAGGRYSHRGSGKLRIKFGGYGSMRQFPEPKAGFDMEKIATEIDNHVKNGLETLARNQKLQAQVKDMEPVAAALNAEFGQFSVRVDNSGALVVRCERQVTEGQARKFLTAMREIFG